MSVDPDKHRDAACPSGSDFTTVLTCDSEGKSKNEEETKKVVLSVRFPEENQLVTQYFEPANPWCDVPSTTRAQLAAEYLESCRRHNTPCIDSVLQQIRELPESSIGGGCRAARLTLAECTLVGVAPADALEAVLRKVQFRTLELQDAVLDDEAAEAIFDMIEYYESANVVSISGPRHFGIRGWQAASRMIKKSAELSELEVSDSPLEASHAPVLARALKPITCRLRALCLQRVALSGEPLLCLVIALKSNSSIRELRLGDNRLGASDCAQIASLLRYNTRIQLLDLSNNQIQDAGVAHLADALAEAAAHAPPAGAASPGSPHHCRVSGYDAQGLAFLVLWNNQLTRNCAPYLSKALRSSQSLRVLNAGRNALGADGVRALSRGALVSLGLQAARLGQDAAPALANLLRTATDLQRLDLRDNRLGSAGLQAILAAVKDNRTLTQLDLDEPPESSTLTADDNEVGLTRRLTLEIRELCRRNETDARRDTDHMSGNALHRRISLTCHTACLQRGVSGSEEERRGAGGRLRSPAPSPAPSPASSPVPAPAHHSRFSVTRVTPERETASSSPPTPGRSAYCPPSRFKVVQVMEPPQIQVHPATTNQPRITTSRFSVTRNYDTIYNSTPTPSPPPTPAPLSDATSIPPMQDEFRVVQGPQQLVAVQIKAPQADSEKVVDNYLDVKDIQTGSVKINLVDNENVDNNVHLQPDDIQSVVVDKIVNNSTESTQFKSRNIDVKSVVIQHKTDTASTQSVVKHVTDNVLVPDLQPSAKKVVDEHECKDNIVQPNLSLAMVVPAKSLDFHHIDNKSVQVPTPDYKFDQMETECSQLETMISDHKKETDVANRIESTVVSKPPVIEYISVTTQTYDSIDPGTYSKTTVTIEPPVKEPKNVKILVTDLSSSDVNTKNVVRTVIETTSVSVQTDNVIISDFDVIVDSIKLVKSNVTYSDVVRNDKFIDKPINRSQKDLSVLKTVHECVDAPEVLKDNDVAVECESQVIKDYTDTRIDSKITKAFNIEKLDPKVNADNNIIETVEVEVDSILLKEVSKAHEDNFIVKLDNSIKKEMSGEYKIIKEEPTVTSEVLKVREDNKIIKLDSVIKKEESKFLEHKDNAIKQIFAFTEDLGHIIQEMKDLTNKNVTKKDNLIPAIRDSVVLKKNKSESSLDSPDLEVSRLMNKRLVGSPFDSNSSLEISESSMESLNEKPSIQETIELNIERVTQAPYKDSSMDTTTPVNSNLLNLSVSSTESVSPIFGNNKKINDSLSSLEVSVSSSESTKQEKVMLTSADSGIEHSLQHPTDNKEDNSSNEGTLTNNSSLKETANKSERLQLLENLTSSPKRTSSLLDMPALKSKGLDRMRKISWVPPSSSFHIPKQDDKEVKPSHLEKLLSIFQHPSSIFSRSTSDDERKCNTPPRKDASLTSSFWSWGSTIERDKDDDSENTDSTLSERIQVSFVDESFSKKLDSKTPSTDTDNTLSEFQSLPTQENEQVTSTTEVSIVQNLDLSLDNVKNDSVIRPNEKIEIDDKEIARPRSLVAVLKSSGSENSLDRQTSPDNGQPVDKLPSKVIRGIKENISPENTLISSMSNTKALAVELAERQMKSWELAVKIEPKLDEVKSDLAPIATIEETCDDVLQVAFDDKKDKKDCIDLGKDALSYLMYENRQLDETKHRVADELKHEEINEITDLSPELVVDDVQAPVFVAKELMGIKTSPVVPDRAKIKSNSLEDLSQLTEDKCSAKTKMIAFKVPESTTPRDIPKRSKLRTRSGSSPKSLPESLNKPCPLNKMESILTKKKKKVSSLGKIAKDSLLALNMSEEELAEFRRSYKLTSVESLKSLESVSEDANSQSGNSVDSRCRSCLRTSQESLMSLDSITEDCRCADDERPGKSGR